MVETNNTIEKARERMQCFTESWHSFTGLDILIDIYDEIRYTAIDKNTAEEKYFKILYNLKDSNSLHNLLDEADRKNLKLFLKDFLNVQYNGEKYFLGEEYFSKLSIDEIYQILIETKYLKNKGNSLETSKI